MLLLAAVAIASTSSVPAGTGAARRPAERFVDVLLSLYLVLMVVCVGMWVYLVVVRRDVMAEALARRKRRSPLVQALTFAICFGVLALFVRQLSTDDNLRQRIANQVSRSQAAA